MKTKPHSARIYKSVSFPLDAAQLGDRITEFERENPGFVYLETLPGGVSLFSMRICAAERVFEPALKYGNEYSPRRKARCVLGEGHFGEHLDPRPWRLDYHCYVSEPTTWKDEKEDSE